MDKISTELYSGGYINFIRFAKAGDFYFKAECRAQMKARVSYAVDVCKKSDKIAASIQLSSAAADLCSKNWRC